MLPNQSAEDEMSQRRHDLLDGFSLIVFFFDRTVIVIIIV